MQGNIPAPWLGIQPAVPRSDVPLVWDIKQTVHKARAWKPKYGHVCSCCLQPCLQGHL